MFYAMYYTFKKAYSSTIIYDTFIHFIENKNQSAISIYIYMLEGS